MNNVNIDKLIRKNKRLKKKIKILNEKVDKHEASLEKIDELLKQICIRLTYGRY